VNGRAANSIGSVLFRADVGNPSDVRVDVSLTDVRQAPGLGDYAGELQETTSVRLTDRGSGPAGDEAATVQDTPFPVTVPCGVTPDPAVGSTCSVSTTFNAVVPGSVPTGKRSVWQLGQVQVFDGGSDGVASTPGNSLFAVQGVFVP
jgi:hypothetical protein